MNDVIFARAIHVMTIVIWIGGVSMVTTVILPAIRRGDFGLDRMKAFQAVEHRFVWQARAAVLIVGLSGLYMIAREDLWGYLDSADFWRIHAMIAVWLLFAFVLFVAEPFILHRRFQKWATEQPDRAFAWLHRVHWLILVLTLATVFGAVAGGPG